MSGRYRYPPKCQDRTDIPQMSGRYRYPPNVRTVQISPKMSGRYRYPPNVRTVTDIPQMSERTDIPQMTLLLQTVDSPTYFISGMASFWKLYFVI
ncbi:unnamed protein product, partial [Staurois parvus]